MAKRYLTKEEKRNFINWKKQSENGTLLTSDDILDICNRFEYDPKQIGEYIIELSKKTLVISAEDSEFDIDINDVPFV